MELRYLLAMLPALWSALLQVGAIEIVTPKELEAVNGTSVRLKCTFKSTHPVSEGSVNVSWSFKPLQPGPDESVFHYQDGPFPPTIGRFKGHAVWSGDIRGNDASITLNDVHFSFNGTYICQVRNPPDFQGFAGEISLKVVQTVSLSGLEMLGAVVGGALGLFNIAMAIYMVVSMCKRRN
ncbi:myelin protein zero-like protein 2 [Denticeps clupeoides]|uniref:myelin protein zero-like protein 2 n=1 Tax=Denticeps clupeoides TaxID=299321 RepID=UPI0010A5067B|nr:myelin protein zero-like protein 2 [Denticeps clupeoides]